jgi:hypothetical protein
MDPKQARTLDEILAELPKFSSEDRRRILDRILEIDDEAEATEIGRRTADEAFRMLDAMEAEDAAGQAR